MKVKAIIRDNSAQWEESFDVPQGADAKEFITKIIDHFNATLRPGEERRELVRILSINKSSDYSDKRLAEEILMARQKQLGKIGSFTFDEISGDYVSGTLKYFKKLQHLEDMLNYMYDMRTVFRYEPLEELLGEGIRRGWKTLRKVKNIFKKVEG